MGNNKHKDRNRRAFLSFLLSGKDDAVTPNSGKPEMVKMLTPDGKLVEVEKSVLDAATRNKKSTNKEIYTWMKNPSKDNI